VGPKFLLKAQGVYYKADPYWKISSCFHFSLWSCEVSYLSEIIRLRYIFIFPFQWTYTVYFESTLRWRWILLGQINISFITSQSKWQPTCTHISASPPGLEMEFCVVLSL